VVADIARIQVSKTVILAPGSSWHAKPGEGTRQASKGSLYILSHGSAICTRPGGGEEARGKLQAGDLFGATRFLLQRAPELGCLCPLLLKWNDASSVEAVTECSLVAFSLSDRDETGLSLALVERLKMYCQAVRTALHMCTPLAGISNGERQWLLQMAQLVSVRATTASAPRQRGNSAERELVAADVWEGTREPQLLVLCSSAAGASPQHLQLLAPSHASVTRIHQLYPLDPSETCPASASMQLAPGQLGYHR